MCLCGIGETVVELIRLVVHVRMVYFGEMYLSTYVWVRCDVSICYIQFGKLGKCNPFHFCSKHHVSFVQHPLYHWANVSFCYIEHQAIVCKAT